MMLLTLIRRYQVPKSVQPLIHSLVFYCSLATIAWLPALTFRIWAFKRATLPDHFPSGDVVEKIVYDISLTTCTAILASVVEERTLRGTKRIILNEIKDKSGAEINVQGILKTSVSLGLTIGTLYFLGSKLIQPALLDPGSVDVAMWVRVSLPLLTAGSLTALFITQHGNVWPVGSLSQNVALVLVPVLALDALFNPILTVLFTLSQGTYAPLFLYIVPALIIAYTLCLFLVTVCLKHLPRTEFRQTTPIRNAFRHALVLCFFASVFVFGFAAVKLFEMIRPHTGDRTAVSPVTMMATVMALRQIILSPASGFPTRRHIYILCLGLDDDWRNSDAYDIRRGNSDTIFILSLDIKEHRAGILSIPRDAYIPIAGFNVQDKINSAYGRGGEACAEATIANEIGIQPDYYIVINSDATRQVVDAMGGVDVNVEHAMNYDDNKGALHIHLKAGFQHLSGDQAVGFVRYRHGNLISQGWLSRLTNQGAPIQSVGPEDGDARRVYRQHVLLRAMANGAKSVGNVIRINRIVDAAMDNITTNLTRTQIFDLAMIFCRVQQSNILTAQLPVVEYNDPNGGADELFDNSLKSSYVNWILQGDTRAGRSLTPVRFNVMSGQQKSVEVAARILKDAGYKDIQLSYPSRVLPSPQSRIIDWGVPNSSAAGEIAMLLGILPANASHQKRTFGSLEPRTPYINVILGGDVNVTSLSKEHLILGA